MKTLAEGGAAHQVRRINDPLPNQYYYSVHCIRLRMVESKWVIKSSPLTTSLLKAALRTSKQFQISINKNHIISFSIPLHRAAKILRNTGNIVNLTVAKHAVAFYGLSHIIPPSSPRHRRKRDGV